MVIKVKELKGFWQRSKGLIGKDASTPVFLKTRFGIHTIGLKFPIDVLVLDNSMKIVVIQENLQPNRIFFWNPFFQNVIEMPAGTIKKEKIKKGDVVDLVG